MDKRRRHSHVKAATALLRHWAGVFGNEKFRASPPHHFWWWNRLDVGYGGLSGSAARSACRILGRTL